MRKILFALCASVLLVTPGFAQAPGGPPTDQGGLPPEGGPESGSGPGGSGPGPGGPRTGGPGGQMRALFADCRSQAQGQGLRGRPLRDAVSECVVRQRPDLAGRMKCRAEGMDKGLRTDDLRSYIRSCVQQAGR